MTLRPVIRHRRGMTRIEVSALIGGAVALILSAALIYRAKVKKAPPAQPAAVVEPAFDAQSEKFKALRAAGLTSLSSGNYDTAVDHFTEALKFGKADSDIIELLKMAKEFAEKQHAKAEPVAVVEPEPAPEPEKPEKPVAVAKPAVRHSPRPPVRRPEPVAPKPEPVREPVAKPVAPEAPARGTVIVTSTPPGLVVEVDGARRDLTPAKISVPVGARLISVWKGTSRLAQRNVEVEADQVALVDLDVSSLIGSAAGGASKAAVVETPKPVEPTPTATPTAAPEPVAAPVKEVPPSAPPKPVVPTPVPTAAPAIASAGAETGDVFVTAASLAGEVFINGAPFGPTPLLARGIATGPALVELKTPQGETRRSKEIVVKAKERVEVRFR